MVEKIPSWHCVPFRRLKNRIYPGVSRMHFVHHQCDVNIIENKIKRKKHISLFRFLILFLRVWVTLLCCLRVYLFCAFSLHEHQKEKRSSFGVSSLVLVNKKKNIYPLGWSENSGLYYNYLLYTHTHAQKVGDIQYVCLFRFQKLSHI